MTLRIAIDVTAAVTQRAGVGRYTRELVRALRDLPNAPELLPFFIAQGAEYPLEGGLTPLMRRQGGRAWRLEALLRQVTRQPMRGPWNRADLYHAPEVIAPPTATPLVTTVHDLSYVTRPQYHTRLNGAYLRAITPLVTRRARLVIADSEATKSDLVHYIGLSEDHVRVVYPSIAAEFWQAPAPVQVAETCARYNLSSGFILSVGTQEPRKNLSGTLAAYRLLRQRLPDAPPLALVGGAGWGLDEQRLSGAGGTWTGAPAGLCAGRRPSQPVCRLRRFCLPLVLRGVGAARGRGAGPGRAGGYLKRVVAARGGRRRGACWWTPPSHRRSPTPCTAC